MMLKAKLVRALGSSKWFAVQRKLNQRWSLKIIHAMCLVNFDDILLTLQKAQKKWYDLDIGEIYRSGAASGREMLNLVNNNNNWTSSMVPK